MASPAEVEMLLDTMREVWDYFERIQGDIASKAATDSLYDQATHLDFKYKLKEIRRLEADVVGDVHAATASPGWDSAYERCSRFLTRSIDNFDALIANYMEIAWQLQGGPKNATVDTTTSHCEGAQRMVDNLVRERVTLPPSGNWPCNIAGLFCSPEDHDHFHTADGLIWPSQEGASEKMLPVGSCPDVDWRHFAYERHQSVETHRKGSVTSALSALEGSVELQFGEQLALDEMALFDNTSEVGNLFQEKRFGEGVATIGLALARVLSKVRSSYTLAIILPRGSQIFYPSSPIEVAFRPIYIKMNEDLSDQRMPYSFQAVKCGKSNWKREDTQTKSFLDLPPEIRNMIYEQVLHQEEDEQDSSRIQHRQPAILYTCRTANKEIMSLVFQKYGWFLSR